MDMNAKFISALLALTLGAPGLPAWGAKLSLPKPAVAVSQTPVKISPQAGITPALALRASAAAAPKPVLPLSPALPRAAIAAPASALPASAAPIQVLAEAAGLAAQASGSGPQESDHRALGAVFDRSARPAPAADPIAVPPLDGIRHKGARLLKSGQPLELLGRGSFGAVYAHPEAPGVAIKLMTASLLARLYDEPSRQASARKDSRVARRLAEAGAGPRVLAEVAIAGEPGALRRWLAALPGLSSLIAARPAVVKERVFGDTVSELIDRRAFEPRHYDLIQDMLGRMADARIRIYDLRTANIMIGHTAADPEPRAYLIDGHALLKVAPEETRDSLFESLKHQRTEIMGGGGGDPGQWSDPHYDPFDSILQKGLRLSAAEKKG